MCRPRLDAAAAPHRRRSRRPLGRRERSVAEVTRVLAWRADPVRRHRYRTGPDRARSKSVLSSSRSRRIDSTIAESWITKATEAVAVDGYPMDLGPQARLPSRLPREVIIHVLAT